MSRNPAVTRAQLLRAARQEFADMGIAGARVDRIAAHAGVSKERIYGHFGSKEKLFDAVVSDALDELTAAVPLGETSLADYVERIFDFHHKDPTLIKLLMWEAMHYRKEKLPEQEARADRYRKKVATMADDVEGMDPGVVLLTVIGMAAWPNLVPQLTEMILGPREDAAGDIRATLAAFTRRALEAPAPSHTH